MEAKQAGEEKAHETTGDVAVRANGGGVVAAATPVELVYKDYADQEVRLTYDLVKRTLVAPTRNGDWPDPARLYVFMQTCRFLRLNPFLREAYLVGYNSSEGPKWETIVAIAAKQRRAAEDAAYGGHEAGVVVVRDGSVLERAGTLVFDGETLLGGWARTHRHGAVVPFFKTVALKTYQQPFGRWKLDPAGMIRKVALSQCLGEAFPGLADMRSPEEMSSVTGRDLVDDLEKARSVAVDTLPKVGGDQ